MIYSAGTYYLPTHIAGNGLSSATNWASIGFNETENDAYPTGGGYSLSGNGVEVILNQNSCISDVIFSSNRIYFKASGSKGNAKVTLTNNGVRVWTWHLWCTDEPATYIINGYSVMDRNMGAITRHGEGFSTFQEMTGFYYPYGYPIGFTAEEYANGVSDGNNPMKTVFALHPEKPYLTSNGYKMPFNAFYAQNSAGYQVEAVWARIWGNGSTKTIYDPCPPGYKVTPKAFWDGIGDVTGSYHGIYKNNAFFPYNGYVYSGTYTDYSNSTPLTLPAVQIMDITYSNLGNTYHTFTVLTRVFLWTSSSSGQERYSSSVTWLNGDVSNVLRDKAYCYTIKKTTTSENSNPSGGGTVLDYFTYGKGVRCVKE